MQVRFYLFACDGYTLLVSAVSRQDAADHCRTFRHRSPRFVREVLPHESVSVTCGGTTDAARELIAARNRARFGDGYNVVTV